EPFAVRPGRERDGLSQRHRLVDLSQRQRAQTETETAWIGADTQVDGAGGFVEAEVGGGSTGLVSKRRGPTGDEATVEVAVAKDVTREERVEGPHVDLELWMMGGDEGNDVEHEHGLATGVRLQVEDQTGPVAVGPDACCFG